MRASVRWALNKLNLETCAVLVWLFSQRIQRIRKCIGVRDVPFPNKVSVLKAEQDVTIQTALTMEILPSVLPSSNKKYQAITALTRRRYRTLHSPSHSLSSCIFLSDSFVAELPLPTAHYRCLLPVTEIRSVTLVATRRGECNNFAVFQTCL